MATLTTTELRGTVYGPLDSVELADDDVQFVTLSAFARRHRKAIIAYALVGAGIGLSVALLLPNRYTARASFVPQGRAQMAALASIAAQFGVGVPPLGGDATRTPAFYMSLLGTKSLLGTVVDQPTPLTGAGGQRVSLATYLSARGDTPGERRESAIKKLLKHMGVSVDQKAGVVSIEVQLRSAQVAQSVVAALLAQLDTFNLRTRRSQASSERRFTEGRLAEAKLELRAAENELLSFLQSNRDYRGSPQLSFMYDRLTRDVTLRQQVYTTMAQAFEQARIEEVRDTPVITIVEAPLLPARHDPAPIGQGVATGILIGLGVAVLLGRRKDRLKELA